MVDRVKVSQNSDRSKQRAQDQKFQIALSHHDLFFGADHCKCRHAHRHKVTEKALLHRREISRKTHKRAHPCK